MPPCLTVSIIRYRSRVKWVNPRKGVATSPTLRCSSYWSLLQFETVRTRPSKELAPQGPRLSSPAEWERSAAIARRAGGQYVAVFVQYPTHLSHITLSQPFQIKWEAYFSKEMYFVCHYWVDYVSACICVYVFYV